MTTDPDIIDQAEDSIDGWNDSHGYPLSGAEPSLLAQWLADAGLLHESDQQRNERMVADAVDLEDTRAERDKAIAERNMAVGRVDEMRQRLAQARAERDEAWATIQRVREGDHG